MSNGILTPELNSEFRNRKVAEMEKLAENGNSRFTLSAINQGTEVCGRIGQRNDG